MCTWEILGANVLNCYSNLWLSFFLNKFSPYSLLKNRGLKSFLFLFKSCFSTTFQCFIVFFFLSIFHLVQNTGECPPMTWYTRCSIPVTHQCTVDVDCDKDEESKFKCCYNGCFMTCQAAVETKPGKPRHKKRSKAFDVLTNERTRKLKKRINKERRGRRTDEREQK